MGQRRNVFLAYNDDHLLHRRHRSDPRSGEAARKAISLDLPPNLIPYQNELTRSHIMRYITHIPNCTALGFSSNFVFYSVCQCLYSMQVQIMTLTFVFFFHDPCWTNRSSEHASSMLSMLVYTCNPPRLRIILPPTIHVLFLLPHRRS